jgi:predicted dehydrogenase
MNSKIRVGIVGANPSRGFASIAHIQALQALPDFEISAVCTTRQDSADAAARHFGVPLAFSDTEKLAQDPNVDLVTVSVKVPDHHLPVMAAIEAGKHVYCEWPLGRNTDEAARMLAAAERRGVRHAIGLQGQVSPAINYTKDLIAEGLRFDTETSQQRDNDCDTRRYARQPDAERFSEGHRDISE